MDTTGRRLAGAVLATLLGAACARPPRGPGSLPSPLAGFAAVGRSLDFTTVAVPGATRTVASGINDAGHLVGCYDDSAGTHGFLLRDDGFATIDFPGAVFTPALGIGARGEIVGAYRMAGEPAVNFHGFLRTRDGGFERVEYPPYQSTIAQRILSDGTILGCRHDDDFGASMKGVVLTAPNHGGTDAFASMHNGATPDLRRSRPVPLRARRSEYGVCHRRRRVQAAGRTRECRDLGVDVNPAGEVVGTYRDSSGVHGFMLTADGFVSVNAPEAAMTRALGINTHGAVVGSLEAGGRTYGFVATPTRVPSRRN